MISVTTPALYWSVHNASLSYSLLEGHCVPINFGIEGQNNIVLVGLKCRFVVGV